jgi:hypothetical protein
MAHNPQEDRRQADCRLVDSELIDSKTLSEAARAHFENCTRCRTLYAWVSTNQTLAAPSSAVQKRILRDLTDSLKPVNPLPGIPVLVAGFVSVFLVLALALIAMTDKAGLRTMTMTQLVSVTAALLAGAALVCVLLVWQMIPGSLRLISAGLAIPATACALVLVMALLFPWPASPAFIREGWPCTLMGLGIAAVVSVFLFPIVRRGAVTSRTAAGAALGGFAGTLAVTVLQFQCMRQQAPHLLVWHLGSLALAILTGALAGRIIGRIAPAPRRSA